MNKELALRTFGYLIGHYKTHEETIINSQEIEAINYILDENERLEQQCKKQKEVIDKIASNIKNDIDGFMTINDHGECNSILDLLNIYLDILKEVSE